MPICRECGSRLTKFDKDICPVCGCEHPFEGQHSDTVDITTEIKSVDPKEIGGFTRKKRKTCLLYSLFLGWCGAPYFYLKYNSLGILHALSLLGLNAIVLLVFLFATPLAIWIPIVIILLTYLISDLILGLVLYFKPDLKDGRGEYLE